MFKKKKQNSFNDHTLTKEIWAGTKEFGPFFPLPVRFSAVSQEEETLWRSESGRIQRTPCWMNRSPWPSEPSLVVLKTLTESGCNKNQENLNHKQVDVLPKSLVPCRVHLTKQLHESSAVNSPLQRRGHEPCKLNSATRMLPSQASVSSSFSCL